MECGTHRVSEIHLRYPYVCKEIENKLNSQGSPTYNLAKYLAEILKPLVGKSEHHVVNSKEFITKIEQTKLDEDEILVSFDVVSLFTNVPIDEACNIAKERLPLDNTLHLRTTLSPENIYMIR